jgi:hypothetical protein
MSPRMRVPIATLAAELTACRIAKRAFHAEQRDVSDAPQLCPRCPVSGLNAKTCHDRRKVTGREMADQPQFYNSDLLNQVRTGQLSVGAAK